MANITENMDIDYVQKDFSSTVDAIITFATVNYGAGTSANRLWTNFNADSFSRNWLEIVALVSDVFFFYFDNQATQSYLQTATVQAAIRDIAKQFGFVPASATSASGLAQFTVTGAVNIPRGFQVSASNGSQFFVTNDIIAVGAGTVTGSVLQGTIKNEQFSAEGLQNEEFELTGPNVIRDQTNLNPLDITPQVYVNGNEYTLVESFIRHNGADTAAVEDSLGVVIGGGGRVFTLEERPNGIPFIRFGDGVFGRKIMSGEVINITYRTGGGSIGNIPEETLNTLVSTLPQVSSVTNNADFSGGSDEQTIEQLRQLIPASLRTLERAVAEQDYSDILVANFSEVFAASTEANLTQPGIDLNIYVVPQGIGITKISDNILLKNRLTNFIDRRKTVTVQFQILDAFGVDTLVGLELFISDTTSKTTVTNSIRASLQNYFSLSTGGLNGSGIGFAAKILLKDIANIVEEVSGIERFEIKKLTYRPRIAPRVIGLITEYNTSDVTIYPNVGELEWLCAASGVATEPSGIVLFSNTSLVGYTYNSGNGELVYSFPVNLEGISPGDQFRDNTSTDFTILAVDITTSTLTLSEGLTIDNTVSTANSGSIRSGGTTYESYKVFKKTKAIATNLSIDSITDNNLDLSVLRGTGTAISARMLLDNKNVFIPGQYSTGEFFLVDSTSNIWEILSNDSNTLTTSISAVNDAGIVAVASGDYKIVKKVISSQVVFQNNVFNIQYNSDNTLYSIGAQFNQIGTISDEFAISELQSNRGNLGVAVDIISYNPSTKIVRLNSAPALAGVNSDYVLIDSSGQVLNITAVDNTSKPSVFYDQIHQDSNFVLTSTGLGIQVAQGFEVSVADQYAVVSFRLKKQGNIVGNLTARITTDDSGLPDLSSIVAVSEPVSVANLNDSNFTKVLFSFVTPPTLAAGTQYHLVLSSDAGYVGSQQSNIKSFDNTSLVPFTYSAISGVVEYAATVNLSNVLPGHYFKDSAGALFKILAVSDIDDELTLDTGLSLNTSIPASDEDGAVYIFDEVQLGLDSSAPTYPNGEFSRFDGSLWSNSTLGPSPSGSTQDLIFSVEGTKTLKIDSNLTPVLGPGATLSTRYYDDENQISLIIGLSAGSVTSAADVNATGRGTVASVPNRPVDTFTFRTSRYADDIINLRLNEIPEISVDDIDIQIYGGVD